MQYHLARIRLVCKHFGSWARGGADRGKDRYMTAKML
jgi:hypothetical protein